jgi:predicted GNAT family acetyltransferase
MLQTGRYYGVRDAGRLLSVAGVHVHSPAMRVAALGNIATHPTARGRGLAAAVTARLCAELLRECDHVGLNVKADNQPAVACYSRLGFAPVAEYEECTLTLAELPG